jgi:two-component system, NtrC family, sensor histidine kinase HydH
VFTGRISLRLLAPTLLISVLLVATCGAGALYVNHLHASLSADYKENVLSTLSAQQLLGLLREMIGVLRDDKLSEEQRSQRIEERFDDVAKQILESQNLADDSYEKGRADTVGTGFEAFRKRWEAKKETHRQLADELERAAMRPCNELLQYNAKVLLGSQEDAQRTLSRLTWALLVAGVAAPLSGLWLGYVLARNLYKSIAQLSVHIRDAAGRLNRELPAVTVEDAGDLDALQVQMQWVVEQIEKVVARLQQSEREVLRSEQLAAVGQVAAGVAHELRNPLTSVKMLAQTGLEGPNPAGLPPEDLRIIEHEVRRMEACIQTFLDFARPPTAERKRCDVIEVVRRTLALVEGRAHKQKVACIAELPSAPVMANIDAGQIHQVLLNLMINALDVLPLGGRIEVEVRGPRTDAPFVSVTVRDNGPGIAEQVRKRLFEPFVSGKETGLGLGLSICQRLIEAHGGNITSENQPSGGAAFTFTIPV